MPRTSRRGGFALTECEARQLLLVKAVEEGDPEGVLLPIAVRSRATLEAVPPESPAPIEPNALSGEAERFLVRRAGTLSGQVARSFPSLQRSLDIVRWRPSLSIVFGAGAFLLGLATNELGSHKRISILAFPLMGMLVWNLGIYTLLALKWLRRVAGTLPEPAEPGTFTRLIWRVMQPARRWRRLAEADLKIQVLQAGAVQRFFASWLKAGSRLHLLRAQIILHSCAALLALGAVAGMYLRGLGLEYLAGWESTFLQAAEVHRLLTLVLGPASAVTGIPIPNSAHLESLRWSAGSNGENAAPWIHLYAATAGLFIVGPRVILAAWLGFKAQSLSRNFPLEELDSPYFGDLLRSGWGAGKQVVVVSVSYSPDARSRERLRLFLREVLGGGFHVDFQGPVTYGHEETFLKSLAESSTPPFETVVLIFNMASTPEEEIHGRLVEDLKQRMGEGRIARQLLLLLDETRYRQRFSAEQSYADKISERAATWSSFARGHGLEIVRFQPTDAITASISTTGRPALWMAAAPENL